MKTALIRSGVVGVPRPAAEAESGAVQIPDHVKQGDATPDGGVTFFRNGVLLVAPPRIWATLEFLSKVTPEEEAAVRINAPYVHTMLLSAHEVQNDDPLTQYAFAQLVAGGILTQQRVDALLEIV